MRYEWIVAFFISLPVFAQDWGRYAGGYIAPPPLAEIHSVRLPDTRYRAAYVAPGNAHPNSRVVKNDIYAPPPGVGERQK